MKMLIIRLQNTIHMQNQNVITIRSVVGNPIRIKHGQE